MRENASTLFQQVEKESEVFEVDPPVLSRWRKMPRRFDGGTDNNARFTSPQQFFTMQYVEVIDLIANKLDERFQQDTLQYLLDIEMVILNAANGKDFDIKDNIRAKLNGDFDLHELKLELKLLKNVATSASCVNLRFVSFSTLTDVCKALNPAMRNIYKNVSKLIQLYRVAHKSLYISEIK